MKKFFLAIMAIMIVMCAASTGHTVVINGERQVQATAPAYSDATPDDQELKDIKDRLDKLEKGQSSVMKKLSDILSMFKGVKKDLKGFDDKQDVTDWNLRNLRNDTEKNIQIIRKDNEDNKKAIKEIRKDLDITKSDLKKLAGSALTTGGAIVAAVILFLGFTAVVFGIFSFFERRRNR